MPELRFSEAFLKALEKSDPMLAEQMRAGTLLPVPSGDANWMETNSGLTETQTLTPDEACAFERWLHGS